MTSTASITTRFDADVKPYERGLGRLDRRLDRWGRGVNSRLERVEARFEQSARSVRMLERALTAVAAAASVGAVRGYAESWRSVERSLASIGQTSDAASDSMVRLALRIRGNVDEVAGGVARLQRSTGADLDTTIRRFETLNKLLAFGGATSAERGSVSLQLGQALQSGVLSGDEFRSLREAAPIEFMQELATSAGVTVAELRGVAEAQELTSDVVLDALDGLADRADEAFSTLAVSGDEAMAQLNTGLTAFIGQLDEASGASSAFNGAVAGLGQFLADGTEEAKALGEALPIVAQAALAIGAGRVVSGLNAYIEGLGAARVANVELKREAVAAADAEIAKQRQSAAAAGERIIALRADLAERQAAGRKVKGIQNQLDKALRDQTTATAAATVATDRHRAAQAALASATSLSARSMRVLGSAMAFFGGPLGLLVTGVSLAVSAIGASAQDATRDIAALSSATTGVEATVDDLAASARDYAAAIRETGDAQTDATDTIVAQTRREFEARKTLFVQSTKVLRDANAERIAANRDLFEEQSRLEAQIERRSRGNVRGGNAGRNARNAEDRARIAEIQAQRDGINARIELERQRIEERDAIAGQTFEEIAAGATRSTRPPAQSRPAAATPGYSAPVLGSPSLVDDGAQAQNRAAEQALERQREIARVALEAAAAADEAAERQTALFRGMAGGIGAALTRGEGLDQVLGNLGQRLIEMAASQAFQGLFDAGVGAVNSAGGVSGIAGALGGLLGEFRDGGYTGNRGVSQVAGVVHGQEFVVNADATRRHRGLLEAINKGLPGYRDGGFARLPSRLPAPAVAPAATPSAGRPFQLTVAPVINIETSSGDAPGDAAAIARATADAVRAITLDTIQREMRPGGALYAQFAAR